MTSEPLLKSSIVRPASTIALLAGIWFFVSPWVYGATLNGWNNWIVGVIVVIVAAIRLEGPPGFAGVSWINCLLGIWIFASPWIYGYVPNSGRFINSLVVGVILFVAAVCSATALPRMTHQTPHRL